MSYLEIDQAKISIIGKNMMRTIYEDGCIFNALHLEKIRKAYTTLHGNEDLRELKLLVICKGDIRIAQDIGEKYLKSRIRHKKGEAFVSKNKTTREYLKAAKAFIPAQHPIQVFEEEDDAKEWLNSL